MPKPESILAAINEYYKLNYEPIVSESFRDGYKACLEDIKKLAEGKTLNTNDGTIIGIQLEEE